MKFRGMAFMGMPLVLACAVGIPYLAAASTCSASDRPRARAEAASRRGAWADQLRFAEEAASAYGRCARKSRGSDYERLVFSKGVSLTLASGGAAGAYGTSHALRAANDARTLFRQVALSPDAAPDIRARANELRVGISRQLPILSTMRLNAAAIPPPAPARRVLAVSSRATPFSHARTADVPASYPTPYLSEAAATPPFDVRAIWYTQGANGVAFIHVRVNMHPGRTMLVQADQFRITVDSASGGRETVYGLMGSAPPYQATNYLAQGYPTISKPAVALNEDLGAGALRLRAGDAITTVVTFRVRADVERSEDISRSLTWFPRDR